MQSALAVLKVVRGQAGQGAGLGTAKGLLDGFPIWVKYPGQKLSLVVFFYLMVDV